MANVKYNRMQAEGGIDLCLCVFLPDGSIIEPIREEGEFHKNGKWSYTDTSLIVPEEAILLCRTVSTHRNGNKKLYLKRGKEEQFLFGSRYDEAPRWYPEYLESASETFGIPVQTIKDILRKVFPEDAKRWDSAPEVVAEY